MKENDWMTAALSLKVLSVVRGILWEDERKMLSYIPSKLSVRMCVNILGGFKSYWRGLQAGEYRGGPTCALERACSWSTFIYLFIYFFCPQ